MPNNFEPRAHPVMGVPLHMTIADLPPSQAGDPTQFLNQVAVATTSAAISMGARGIEIIVEFQLAGGACDLVVYRVDPGPTDTVVKTFTAVSSTNRDHLYVGNLERVDLEGKDVKIRAQNLSGGSWVSVWARRKS